MTTRDRLTDIPDLATGGTNTVAWARAMTESMQTFRGLRGDPLDKALTRRDVANGALDGVVASGGVGPQGPPGPTVPTGVYQPIYVEDLTPPPTPTGLVVTAGFTKIIVQCDPQTYTQGHGHNRTNVYGAKWPLTDPTAPTFSEAVRLWSFLGTVDSYATDASTRWCIWIKWQSLDGVESTSPAGGLNGEQATTGVDIPLVLEALAGQITASELATSLATPISLVTAADTVPGSVNARIRDEQLLRVDGDILVRTLAQNYTNDYAYSLDNGNALAGSVSTLSVSVNSPTSLNNPTFAALQIESATRATLDGDVRSLYTVRTEVSSGGRTLIGGFGLAGTAGGAEGPTIDFGVLANRFWVGAPLGSGLSDRAFFTIQTTTWVDNGVTRPAGMYVDAAFIYNLQAIYATIGTLVADQILATDITVSRLIAGTLRVGADMRSTGFVSGPGGVGWRLDGAGNLEANNATIRGAVFASSGTFAGSLLAATGTFAGTLKVGSNPTITGTTMTGSGAIINADGTFALGTAAGNITYNGTGAPVLNGFETPVATLSAYSVNFAADSTGLVDVGQSFPVTLIVRRGSSEEAAAWTFSVSNRSDPTVTTTGSGSTLSITGLGTALDAGWVEFIATRSGFATQGPMRVNVGKLKRAAADSGPVSMPGLFDADALSQAPSDASAFITFRPDGTIWGGNGAGAKLGDWYLPNTSGVGSGFDVRFDQGASSGPGGGLTGVGTGTWNQINVDRTISLSTTEDFDTLRVQGLTYTTRDRVTGLQTGGGSVYLRAEVFT